MQRPCQSNANTVQPLTLQGLKPIFYNPKQGPRAPFWQRLVLGLGSCHFGGIGDYLGNTTASRRKTVPNARIGLLRAAFAAMNFLREGR